MDEPWYSARCLFVINAPEGSIRPRRVYEERIVLFRAADFEDALRQAEDEARRYAASLEGCRYLEHVDVFHLFDDELVSGTELYSLFRNGDPDPEAFVENFTTDFWQGIDSPQSPPDPPSSDAAGQ
ncbi:MAG: DUF4288 domain-containing protein [Planctomycetaceae bacterium]|nr:DUF4288 domain-containing protein [Planctomycetaceae bacterium]